MKLDQFTVNNMRDRTKVIYENVARPDLKAPLPIAVIELFQVLIHRINDLEEASGYDPATAPTAIESKVNTQGR